MSESRDDFGFPALYVGLCALTHDLYDGKLLKKPASSELTDAANALAENLARVTTLAEFPVWLTELSVRHQLLVDWAMYNLTGEPFPQADKRPSPEAHRGEVYRLADAMRQPDAPTLITLAPRGMSADAVGYDLSGLHQFVGTVALFGDSWVGTAMQSLYSAILTGAYTAFEIAATDIWLAAVNARPRTLAANALKFGRDESGAKGQEPSIPLPKLVDSGFDISPAVGDFLKEDKRAKFDSLNGIEAAYKAAFRIPEDKKQQRPSNRLSALFDSANGDLNGLEAVRNLLVHRGGKADEKFRGLIRGYDDEWYATPLGDSVRIDGDRVAKLVAAAARFSSSLLAFVDDWLSKYTDFGPGPRPGDAYVI